MERVAPIALEWPGASNQRLTDKPLHLELQGTHPPRPFHTPFACRLAQARFTLTIPPTDMNTLKKPILAQILLAFGAILGGCTNKTARDTSIPWSRPADWEGQMPGMGQGH